MNQLCERAGRRRGRAPARLLGAAAAATLLGAGLAAAPASALTINVTQSSLSLAGPASGSGSGTLLGLAQAAATVWEAALDDGGAGTVVNIAVAWRDISSLGATVASTSPTAGPGMIGMVNERQVLLDADAAFGWYLDPTPYDVTGDYATIAEVSTVAGAPGGSLEAGRRHEGATGEAAGRYDAFTVLLHEFAHALGFGGFGDGSVTIVEPGTSNEYEVPLVDDGGGHIRENLPGTGAADLNSAYNDSLLYTSIGRDLRILPSQVDVLTVAEIVGYQLGLSGAGVGAELSSGAFGASAVPLPAAGGLLAAGLAILGAARRRSGPGRQAREQALQRA